MSSGFMFTSVVLLLSLFVPTVVAKELPDYAELVAGLSPSQTRVKGVNEMLDRMSNTTDSQFCAFFIDMMSTAKAEALISQAGGRDKLKKLGADTDAPARELAKEICVRGNLAGRMKSKPAPALRLTEDRILKVEIKGNLAILTARNFDNKIVRSLMVKEEGVWRTDGAIPDDVDTNQSE